MLRSFTFALLLLSGTSAAAADLTVQIGNIRTKEGSVRVAVYNNPDTFLKPEGVVAVHAQTTTADTTTVLFRDLPPGTYAVALFHDENGNQELDRNLLGIPTEGVAFSQDASGSFGPPDFADAAVTLAEGAQKTTSANLKY